MAEFRDSTGSPYLPIVDQDGNVPVAIGGVGVEQQGLQVQLAILRGIEMLIMLQYPGLNVDLLAETVTEVN